MGVYEQVVPVYLTQHRVNDLTHYNLADELSSALIRSINALLQSYPNLDPRDRLYFSIGSQYLSGVCDGWNVTVSEWQNNDEEEEPRVAQVFRNPSALLNSNENFRMDQSFTLSLVIVRAGPRGGGKTKKKVKRLVPGVASAASLPRQKRSILTMPKDDRNMCCAEALLTTWKYRTLSREEFKRQYNTQNRKFLPFQMEAQQLQSDAGIPLGTVCGSHELERFADYFAPMGFCIIVVDSTRCYQRYKYGTGERFLALFYTNNHYDGLVSLPGFFTTNLFCFKCLTPFNQEGMHQCPNNKDHCSRCLQDGCIDFLSYRQQPSSLNQQTCNLCHVTFYGPSCFQSHLNKTYAGKQADATHLNVCATRKICPHCGKRSTYHGRDRSMPPHKCYHSRCKSCTEYVDLSQHRCFIQTTDQMKERRERQAAEREARAEERRRARGYDPNNDPDDNVQRWMTRTINVSSFLTLKPCKEGMAFTCQTLSLPHPVKAMNYIIGMVETIVSTTSSNG